MTRLGQTAVACGLSIVGLLCGLRLLYRAIDDMTTFPAYKPVTPLSLPGVGVAGKATRRRAATP